MAECSICRDNFDGVERVSTSHCGHVYHNRCILQWLNHRNTCPECRTAITRESIINLYFTPSAINSDNALRNELEHYKTLVNSHASLINESADRIRDLLGLIIERESEVENLKRAAIQRDIERSTDKRKIYHLGKDLFQVQEERDSLREKLKMYNDIKEVVMGTKVDCNEILQQVTGGSQNDYTAVKRLAYCVSLTKRELQKMICDKSKLLDEKVKIAKDLLSKTTQLNAAQVKIKRLNHQLSQTQEMVNKSVHGEGLPTTSKKRSASPSVAPSSPNRLALTPISAGFDRPRMNVVIAGKGPRKVNVDKCNFTSPQFISSKAKRAKVGDSISSVGYDGMGSHHTIINRSKTLQH